MHTSCTETRSILKKTKGFLKATELVNYNREVRYTQTKSKLAHHDNNFKVIFLFLRTLTQHSLIIALSEE